MSVAPGAIRDKIISYLQTCEGDASPAEIVKGISPRSGTVSSSSVRSYLSLNTPKTFARTAPGRYRLNQPGFDSAHQLRLPVSSTTIGQATLFHTDCFDWLASQPAASVHAVVTDPPYGLVEYTTKETEKLRSGQGGIWRIPPSFDGHARSPLPRFTVLSDQDREALRTFFTKFGRLIERVLVPGANVVIASNPLLSHIVADALSSAGLELRGYIARQVMTMRGGDRPKNAHHEFEGVSVMPRSQWEPWVVLRKPLEGRVQDNLRKWKTGGFRRPNADQPFGDVIRSNPTPSAEKKIAPHPSLKPQAFMRQLVRGVLPLGEGIILDPFMGGGSTLAAANAIGYQSIGLEIDEGFYGLAADAIPQLASLIIKPA
ncbi:DNA methyltransferase [Pseudomonas aeruginosa]|uniref:Methyltransferase n=1 Tax=Rhodanobacter denitrificans TaxID=666685 RepID=A0A2W5JXB9_9GAMM|nr:MAG: DNA methylase [Rhodanobacter denitrificans]